MLKLFTIFKRLKTVLDLQEKGGKLDYQLLQFALGFAKINDKNHENHFRFVFFISLPTFLTLVPENF